MEGVEANKKETVLLPTNASTGLMKLLFTLASAAHDIAASDMEKVGRFNLLFL